MKVAYKSYFREVYNTLGLLLLMINFQIENPNTKIIVSFYINFFKGKVFFKHYYTIQSFGDCNFKERKNNSSECVYQYSSVNVQLMKIR